MVGNRKAEDVVDSKLPEMPSSKALKRILLVALRCVDPDAQKRPKMGHVIHMLEADDLLFRDVSLISIVYPIVMYILHRTGLVKNLLLSDFSFSASSG